MPLTGAGEEREPFSSYFLDDHRVVAGFDWGKFLHIVKTALEVANIEEL